MKKCICCGMPMNKKNDFAMGDESKDYWVYCAKEDGSMKSFDEAVEGMAEYMSESEKIDKKLLTIKIIESSKSLRKKVVVWLSQMARGIKEILTYCHTGIKEWQVIEKRNKLKQIQLKL